MKEKVKEKLTLTRVAENGDTIIGYQHRLAKDDVEYSVLTRLREGETLSLSNDIIDKYFEKDYNKALKIAEGLEDFDKLHDNQKVKILTQIIKKNYD